MMVQHLEREMELNGLLAPNETNITGVHQIEVQDTQQAPNPPKPTGPCYGCGQPGHVVKNCRKVARKARKRGNRVPNTIVDPCETCGKKSHSTQDCYSGANWANRRQWWKTPKTTPPNNIPITPQQGQYVKENSQITQPQYHNLTIGQMCYLPWTGSEDGKFTSSTNTTVKLRPKKTTHNGTLTTRPTTILQNDPYQKAPPPKPTFMTPTSIATRTTIPNFMTEEH